MGLEIERKFLVRDESWRNHSVRELSIVQGYLARNNEATVVRIRLQDQEGFLTVKAAGDGLSRPEFEYSIPVVDARQLLDLCPKPLLNKARFLVPWENMTWEIDVFAGSNKGLVLAECELERPGQALVLPPWLGEEVTGDLRYTNAQLSISPCTQWVVPNQE